jgi:hypothetical protein
MKRKTAVSLSFELGQILDAVEAARLLAYPLQEVPGTELDPQFHRVVAGVVAGLAMVVARLHVVMSVVRDERDPFALLAPHNAVPDDDEHADVLLHSWSAERIVEDARATLSLVEKRSISRVRGKRR